MRRTFLAGLALISLAGCRGGAKEQPTVAQFTPPAMKPPATRPRVKAKATKPKARKVTPARKATRKAPTPVDTATPRNPLLNH